MWNILPKEYEKEKKMQALTSQNTPDGAILLILMGDTLCKESAFMEILDESNKLKTRTNSTGL